MQNYSLAWFLYYKFLRLGSEVLLIHSRGTLQGTRGTSSYHYCLVLVDHVLTIVQYVGHAWKVFIY